MSDREKKLLIFFATAGFIVINFLALGFYKTKRIEVDRQNAEARRVLDNARMISDSRDQVADEMEWLARHEPEPAATQDVQTKLQQICEREARATGLTIKSQKPLPTETGEGNYFHRSKFQFNVNGSEEALYRWFDRLNVPDQLRIASSIRLSPNSKDDTQIDCVAVIDQWFVPIEP